MDNSVNPDELFDWTGGKKDAEQEVNQEIYALAEKLADKVMDNGSYDEELNQIWVGYVEGDPVEAVEALAGKPIPAERILIIKNCDPFFDGRALTLEKDGKKAWYQPFQVFGLVAVRVSKKEAVKIKVSCSGKQKLIDDPMSGWWTMAHTFNQPSALADEDETQRQLRLKTTLHMIEDLVEPSII
ncbi:hypothetical protein [Sphingobium sp. LSP13-1-1.1]|uniref:hypothetical protein n=1 Tax=Sphingobium sp. LSP13-1-1.1 TaxID=3135234 RepID=UPI00342B267E